MTRKIVCPLHRKIKITKNKIFTWGLAIFLLFLSTWPLTASAASALSYPAPTLLVPESGARRGQDRAWVGGVAKNKATARVLIDGEERARLSVRPGRAGTGSFGVKLPELPLGRYVVTAQAEDPRGKESAFSNPLTIIIAPKTPAPVLRPPVVNVQAGVERPFIVGNTRNGLEVNIVIDNRIVKTLRPEPRPSGIASFAWQVEKPLSLGAHKIEVFASDKGKLSNNSPALIWQVGEKKKAEAAPGENSAKATTAPDEQGQIDTQEPVAQSDEGVKEVSPGAVVRTSAEAREGGFKFNPSLIIGLVILLFLLIMIAVWHSQEKKDKLGDKVTELFRDQADDQPPPTTLPFTKEADQGRRPDEINLPPPPPPVF